MSLARYAVRRVLIMIPLLFGLSLFIFVLIRLAPGDPTAFFMPPGQSVDPAVREVAGHLTPVPKGVGPMTIAMLLKNTLEAAKRQAQRG